MKATRMGELEYAAIKDQITHALVWRPQWATKRGASPTWELLTFAEFCSGGDVFPAEAELPEGAPVPALADWVRQCLGHPVALHRDTHAFAVPRRLRLSLRIPVYYVVPGGQS
jgi:hypothetical protein